MVAMSQPDTTATQRMAEREISRPASLQEWVLVNVRRLLLEGELIPGQRVNQGELATRLGVSPVPVREALHVLGSEGMLKVDPGRGFWVTEPSSSDVAEIDLLARLLEREALKRGVPRLTDDQLGVMKELYSELLSLEGSDDIVLKARVHRELHFVPLHAAGLRLLEADLVRYWDHIDHHRVLYMFKDRKNSRQALRQHQSIIEACRTRDADEVIRANEAHRDFATTYMLERASEAAVDQSKEA